ncbi:hypothetical protein [Kitasatospora azatica]|uniref:hypothetical protein n=1 Tax=Kitasatospora azatica TaxID=58347 RepID=UPI00055FB11F|nr:hypothetical protein [Kitasatospora azatica]
MIEYEIYRQRNAELRAAAAHERLADEARRANRAARGQDGTVAARIGRFTAGLRRTPAHTTRAAAEC